MRGFKIILSLTVACVFASSTFAQAPIKKPEKKQQTTTTTTTKPETSTNTNRSSQTMTDTNTQTNTNTDTITLKKLEPKADTDTRTNSSSTSTSTNTQESNSNTTTTTSTTTTPAPKPTTGTINGHEWVDLGLSVKWATCNVGAKTPSGYGNYYAWGETSTKSKYTGKTIKTWSKSMGSIAGNPQHDVARANWGSTWRLPTASEIDELVNKCNREWTTQGGHNGYKITGPNGNSIFLPATGFRIGRSLHRAGESGHYWGATLNEAHAYSAYEIYFYGDDFCGNWGTRSGGHSVRPVSD